MAAPSGAGTGGPAGSANGGCAAQPAQRNSSTHHRQAEAGTRDTRLLAGQCLRPISLLGDGGGVDARAIARERAIPGGGGVAVLLELEVELAEMVLDDGGGRQRGGGPLQRIARLVELG